MKSIALELDIANNCFHAASADGLKRNFDFPAVAVGLSGKRITAQHLVDASASADGGFTARYREEELTIEITVAPGGSGFFFKTVTLRAEKELPTPDYVDVDFQQQCAPGLERYGYMTTDNNEIPTSSEEEGSGYSPECGYPLVGDDFFTGLEHPAAFSTIIGRDGDVFSWRLRHHPVWEDNGVISCIRAVIGMDPDAVGCFRDYIDTFRLPIRKNFQISCCSFWSDPYLGNYEYKVDKGNYTSLVNAFSKQGLRPDYYTLDAGWQDRRSFYDAKPDFGGNKALKELGEVFRSHGSDLSLWISINGPMGMERGFLESHGITVGKGPGSGYRGNDFAVMMDKNLEKKLIERFCELCGPEYRSVQFKVDWDNECSTHPDFYEKYPSVDHVREGSTNAMLRIFDAMRKVNPDVSIRSGYQPSPWWLGHATHVFLWSSGDSEFSSMPSLSQRESAQTHRDACYYAIMVRDKSFLPLDAVDNHEFPHALRNPFVEHEHEWYNVCLWTIMRGTSYITLKIQPEALEKYQSDSLVQAIEYGRKHKDRILTGRSFVTGGCPSHGEIYGFCHPGADGSVILALRNPSPIPQKYVLPETSACYCQTYPCYQNFKAGDTVWFTPHEVKVFTGMKDAVKLPAECCQLVKTESGKAGVYLPSSLRPGVAEIYQIEKLEQKKYELHDIPEGLGIEFGVRVPYRTRETRLSICLKGASAAAVSAVNLNCGRYAGWGKVTRWQVPYCELFGNNPGYGEVRNSDVCFDGKTRYFSAELPQGGECYLNLTLTGKDIKPEDVELYVSGFEAPAMAAEPETFELPESLEMPYAHPYGFPAVIKLGND